MIHLESGDIVYAKGVAKFGTTGSMEYRAGRNEHYICCLLGVIDRREKLPTEKECQALGVSIGLINLDDVTECLGEEQARLLTEYVINKYYPPGHASEHPATPDDTKAP